MKLYRMYARRYLSHDLLMKLYRMYTRCYLSHDLLMKLYRMYPAAIYLIIS